MISALRWIWDTLRRVLAAVLGLAQSIVTWLTAALGAIAYELVDLVGDAFSNALPDIEWPDVPDVVGDFCAGLVHSLALDTALGSLAVCLTAWVLARVARLAMVPIRAVLEIL